MKQFSYTINRPCWDSRAPCRTTGESGQGVFQRHSHSKGEKSAEATRLMGLGIKCGDTVSISAAGPDEEVATASMEQFFREHL